MVPGRCNVCVIFGRVPSGGVRRSVTGNVTVLDVGVSYCLWSTNYGSVTGDNS